MYFPFIVKLDYLIIAWKTIYSHFFAAVVVPGHTVQQWHLVHCRPFCYFADSSSPEVNMVNLAGKLSCKHQIFSQMFGV
jgi:hypothetical protein